MEEDIKTLNDYWSTLRRHKYLVASLSLALMIITMVVVVMLPPVYQSDATILIEQQHIPTDLIKSTVTSYADERIRLIEQRIMTIGNLSKVIDKFGLYQNQQKKTGQSELVDLFKENALVTLVNADVSNKGRSAKATIAFKLGFSDKEPEVAQRVANELVTLFLNENVRTRTQSAEETTKFLEEEAEKFKTEIQKIENAIAEYKQKYSGSLPELMPVNLSMISRLESELQQLALQEKMLSERRISLSAQIAVTSPSRVTASNASGATPASSSLAELKDMETNLLSKYSESHPDVMRLRRQIEKLEQATETPAAEPELAKSELALGKLKERYSENHPEVKAMQRKVNDLQKGANDSTLSAHKDADDQGITNPAYLQLKSELEIADIELQNLRSQRVAVQGKLEHLEANVSQTHQVERGYYELMRDLENHKNKYQELKSKQLEAKLAQTLEEEQKAESFTLIEPPLVPKTPIKPNRLKIMMVGFIGSLGLGFASGLLADMLSGSIRGHRALVAVTGFEPLVVVPYIKNEMDELRTRNNIRLFALISFILFVVVIGAIHFLYMPLDMLFYKIWQRIGLI